MNDAEHYIEAVAKACTAAGLNVTEWGSDDIDPRDGLVTITLAEGDDGDPDDDWQDSRTLGWDEEKGWAWGTESGPHGGLKNIVWLGLGALPDPADVAEEARRLAAGEVGMDEYRRMMDMTHYRDQEDEDGFDEQLAAYAPTGPASPEATQ